MKATIDTEEKTIVIKQDVGIEELVNFVNKFGLLDYKIVQEKKLDINWPSLQPVYPFNPYITPTSVPLTQNPIVTCKQ